ncbi:hypothetical protein AFK20_06355 [Enhydrobacter aerosaccus]|uniref:Uncharacterized protein n=1 Tax=Enhydrobacter aerosaccus TaxID=225324 RepID=A0ABR5IM74_9HYPH|nr:hypothetical protein AFK20_06355 [Enhydrobacter aerosaccus]
MVRSTQESTHQNSLLKVRKNVTQNLNLPRATAKTIFSPRYFIGSQSLDRFAPNEPLLNANFTPADNLP